MANILKNKENRSVLKNEIEDLLSGINHDEFSGLNADAQILEETKTESQYDFDKMDLEFNEKAKEITDSLFEYYVELGVLEKTII